MRHGGRGGSRLGFGFTIEPTPQVATERRAPEPGRTDPEDALEDVREVYYRNVANQLIEYIERGTALNTGLAAGGEGDTA